MNSVRILVVVAVIVVAAVAIWVGWLRVKDAQSMYRRNRRDPPEE